jgi:hypothetical protein
MLRHVALPEDTILHSHRRENLKSYILISLFKFPQVQSGQLIID